ncbi:MAG: 1-deoxy-D-xylulose-5-phosphate reductoisomerase, partial [Deltaproteobacteria bacterium]
MKNISILGSTGSIGVNTLDVIKANPHRFKVVALAGGSNVELLAQQIAQFRPPLACVIDELCAHKLKKLIGNNVQCNILYGNDGYEQVASVDNAHMVVAAIVGSAGLLPTIAGINAGKDIALANKEVLVMAGAIVMGLAQTKGVKILPIDSEHSAIFQCLNGERKKEIKKIILTASGGPFFSLPIADMEAIKPSDALQHPNWRMGRKVTIDSASMMNKGLEVIEAKWLFDIPAEQISVLVHPQSIVHSLVEFYDGSRIAQMSLPDMRIPIAYALGYP